ncbi:MAG: AbrB/MazE/SpoVT family DNA-binding domain-containing protein [Acidimicrobiia bacterium]
MDAGVDVFYGPNPIAANGTITIPKELLREIGMESGDKAQWVLNPAIPGTLVLVPNKNLARLTSEILDRLRDTA